MQKDSQFTYTPQQYILSYGETALYLSAMRNPTTGVTPLEYVKVFFGMIFHSRAPIPAPRPTPPNSSKSNIEIMIEQERLPYNEGWRPTTQETNLFTLGSMIMQLIAANKDALPEGLEITTNSLKLAFGGYDPITGVLAHVV